MFYSIRYPMHDYYVNSRFRFGIMPEFDVWLARLQYLRAVKTTRDNVLHVC